MVTRAVWYDDTPPTISLVFSNGLKVAGETLEGEVHLNFPLLMKSKVSEVHIKLRGSVYTEVKNPHNRRRTESQRVDLIRENISLWQQGNGVFPPPDTHDLKLPFRFTTPPDLPPSCEFSGYQKRGNIGYSLEVVGRREGLHLDKRLWVAFPVVPADPFGAQLRRDLQLGWQGAWKTVERSQGIRKGIWGDYSNVKMILVLPDIPVFPILTPIPFTLSVVTMSKKMKQEDAPANAPVFPAPPSTPQDIDFRIERQVRISAFQHSEVSTEHFVSYVGGMGPEVTDSEAEFESMDKVWIPSRDDDEKEGKGQWKQEVLIRSVLRLSCPPTFHSQSMGVQYIMRLEVIFPGIGNNLKAEFEAKVASCMVPPGPQAVAWDGPPPEMELPPAYFSAQTHGGDGDKD
ncbi:hypothetical protein BDW22DRAFT_1389932 [Trametopsis cervina]|nr:hypothetical protein BDW22DRAFT_1389932 [Trametopsis cervina]